MHVTFGHLIGCDKAVNEPPKAPQIEKFGQFPDELTERLAGEWLYEKMVIICNKLELIQYVRQYQIPSNLYNLVILLVVEQLHI